MPTPFLPLTAWTGSFSVQNRTDESGVLATYVAVRGTAGHNMQLQFGNTETPVAVFKLDRTLISTLTASMSSALATTATGSF